MARETRKRLTWALLAVAYVGLFACSADKLAVDAGFAQCPVTQATHGTSIQGMWRLKRVSQAGQCPPELALTAPLEDGDYRLTQGDGLLTIERLDVRGDSFEIALVEGGQYCHERLLTYGACSLQVGGFLALSKVDDGPLELTYTHRFARGDSTLCPAQDFPATCEVTYRYMGLSF